MIDHVFAGRQLRLTYVRAQRLPNGLPLEPEIRDAFGMASQRFHHLGNIDHLLLATNPQSGALAGALGARDGSTDSGQFLMLQTCAGPRDPIEPATLQRMFAAMLLRIIGLEQRPDAVVIRSGDSELGAILRKAAGRIVGAALHAPSDVTVIPFVHAALAYRIRRTIRRWAANEGGTALPVWMLDLRQVEEHALIEGIRRLYRAGPAAFARTVAAIPVLAAPEGGQRATGQPRR